MLRLSLIKSIRHIISILANRKIWISLFVLLYLGIALVWLSPQVKSCAALRKELIPLVSVLGLDENWALFSPDIREFNLHNIALITFADGTVKLYEWPRMEKSSDWEKFQNEKYRKMFNDCLPWPVYKNFLPSVARYVAAANLNPNNQPLQISLCHFWTDIPKPKNWVLQNQLPPHDRLYNYFVYQVENQDLQ